ncbi:hypothetical protein KsCSTR_40900 [Candidatus Kuenenia stuttgartiensis]|uniref:Uncharacterized protein n=1 Tax=Kuenenia stuttgartiensis TaxID=174633 RepID=Q1Q7H9_KUEST|nr:hypothetical protein KsCSTR_40900 [Candidatus Kuenenia stuttgartiensis]CAJ70781.1 unknown protein [Candidatus Kuenenia stuttgartiensis]
MYLVNATSNSCCHRFIQKVNLIHLFKNLKQRILSKPSFINDYKGRYQKYYVRFRQ